ncbi:MAG: glutamate ligase domain-containing protein, partial [Kiloniellales bacterium]
DGLASFDASFETNPGRFNLRNIKGFRIAVDYAHNEAKFRAVAELTGALDVGGERICAFCAAGDRDDAQLARMASVLASRFERFLVFESKNLRGRAPGSVPEVLAQALIGAGVPPERIARHANSADAIAALLADARPGDFALLIADDIYANWRQVAAWPGAAKAG